MSSSSSNDSEFKDFLDPDCESICRLYLAPHPCLNDIDLRRYVRKVEYLYCAGFWNYRGHNAKWNDCSWLRIERNGHIDHRYIPICSNRSLAIDNKRDREGYLYFRGTLENHGAYTYIPTLKKKDGHWYFYADETDIELQLN